MIHPPRSITASSTVGRTVKTYVREISGVRPTLSLQHTMGITTGKVAVWGGLMVLITLMRMTHMLPAAFDSILVSSC